jgi:hypothetical protein
MLRTVDVESLYSRSDFPDDDPHRQEVLSMHHDGENFEQEETIIFDPESSELITSKARSQFTVHSSYRSRFSIPMQCRSYHQVRTTRTRCNFRSSRGPLQLVGGPFTVVCCSWLDLAIRCDCHHPKCVSRPKSVGNPTYNRMNPRAERSNETGCRHSFRTARISKGDIISRFNFPFLLFLFFQNIAFAIRSASGQ